MNAPFRLTPMHQWHQAHRANIVSKDGWMHVSNYGNTEEEVAAGRSSIGIYDATAVTKIEAQGLGCLPLADSALGIRLPQPGGCTPAITRQGAFSTYIVSLTADRFLLLAATEHRDRLLEDLVDKANRIQCSHVNDVTSVYAAVYLIGPATKQLLKRIGAAPVDTMPLNAAVQIPSCRVWSLLIQCRLLETSLWVLLMPRDYGEYVWESLFHAGREFGIRAVGAHALEKLIGNGVVDVAAV